VGGGLVGEINKNENKKLVGRRCLMDVKEIKMLCRGGEKE